MHTFRGRILSALFGAALPCIGNAQLCPTIFELVLDDDTAGSLASFAADEAVGTPLAVLGDLDGDGTVECVAGTPEVGTVGVDEGGFWLFSFEAAPDPDPGILTAATKYAPPSGASSASGDRFGASVARPVLSWGRRLRA